MGPCKFVIIQCDNFAIFIDTISKQIEEVWVWYFKHTDSHKPLVSMAHDVWDGRRKQINGLAIFFLHPETLKMFSTPVASTPPTDRKAPELCSTRMMGLAWVGIELGDMFPAVNDNCTTAVKTVWLLIGGEKGEIAIPTSNGLLEQFFSWYFVFRSPYGTPTHYCSPFFVYIVLCCSHCTPTIILSMSLELIP